jgi:hypothetical protein
MNGKSFFAPLARRHKKLTKVLKVLLCLMTVCLVVNQLYSKYKDEQYAKDGAKFEKVNLDVESVNASLVRELPFMKFSHSKWCSEAGVVLQDPSYSCETAISAVYPVSSIENAQANVRLFEKTVIKSSSTFREAGFNKYTGFPGSLSPSYKGSSFKIRGGTIVCNLFFEIKEKNISNVIYSFNCNGASLGLHWPK